MALLVDSLIQTTFMDVAHYDVVCDFPNGYKDLNSIVITDASGLRPFIISDGKLQTQVISIDAYATPSQDTALRSLYRATVHPNYIDQRYPVRVTWGHTGEKKTTLICYLSDFMSPEKVNYTKADLLPTTLILRAIRSEPHKN